MTEEEDAWCSSPIERSTTDQRELSSFAGRIVALKDQSRLLLWYPFPIGLVFFPSGALLRKEATDSARVFSFWKVVANSTCILFSCSRRSQSAPSDCSQLIRMETLTCIESLSVSRAFQFSAKNGWKLASLLGGDLSTRCQPHTDSLIALALRESRRRRRFREHKPPWTPLKGLSLSTTLCSCLLSLSLSLSFGLSPLGFLFPLTLVCRFTLPRSQAANLTH